MSREGASSGVLATKLYPQLASRTENLLFSPYSIAAALAMCQSGASGATREEIETALGAPGAGRELLEAFGELRKVLESRARPAPEPFELSVASALWRQSGYSLKPAFVEAMERLAADLREADFAGSPLAAISEVNAWVKEATRGRISEILPAGAVDRLTRVTLANAVFFKAPWLRPFNERFTRREPFHTLDGRTADVPMMQETSVRRYARKKDFEALEVPYGNDWVVMLLVLPAEGKFFDVERNLDSALVLDLLRKTRPIDVKLSLPRFQIESNLTLKEPLQRVGIRKAFQSTADFTELSDEPEFYVGDLLHNAVVDVDEKGTEAAAATAMILTLSTPRRSPPPIEFRVDRPFLFIIADKPTGTVLFVGRVLDPRN